LSKSLVVSIFLSIVLLANESFAITSLNLCMRPTTGDDSLVMADMEARTDSVRLWEEIDDLEQEQASRRKWSSLTTSAMGTEIQKHAGLTIKLLQRGRKWQAYRLNRWVWRNIYRAYAMNENNESRISDTLKLMEAGKVSARAGQEIVAKLAAEIEENKVTFAMAWGYFHAVGGYMVTASKGAAKKNANSHAEGANVALRSIAPPRAEPEVAPDFVQESVDIVTMTSRPDSEAEATLLQKTASDVLEELKKEAEKYSTMFPNLKLPKDMPSFHDLEFYYNASPESPEQQLAVLKKERRMDRMVSIQLGVLSDVVLGPLRKLAYKLPLRAQPYVLNVINLGHNRASRLRYIPELFDILNLDIEHQIAELEDRNRPTEDQLLVAAARMFPELYVDLLERAREDGKKEAIQKTLEKKYAAEDFDFTVLPKKSELPLSPKLNFYYKMLGALKAANKQPGLSVDANGNIGERISKYVGAVGALGVTAWYNWPTVQPYWMQFSDMVKGMFGVP
jgi:hypothetical protein